ncbi:1-phosphatidylinositol 3-phosphate 5-kinase-related [Anaeramoeba ignava]|uniref:1-phosphatidylinositol 3-phosphate 5-kinase-related n=1 Tax=Anaeramoeba ignava TaxID=1746090 RepID=A0A9Q0LL98_ANAIG|nr:1-phosphatidylinositol 3-phosphate 5-kinase-related [Anaeramoeba ignava]
MKVMDYSLLVGIDDKNHQIIIVVIDYLRQYTWDKQLESWVKRTGLVGGGQKAKPQLLFSPEDYKNRFQKYIQKYFQILPTKFTVFDPSEKFERKK